MDITVKVFSAIDVFYSYDIAFKSTNLFIQLRQYISKKYCTYLYVCLPVQIHSLQKITGLYVFQILF